MPYFEAVQATRRQTRAVRFGLWTTRIKLGRMACRSSTEGFTSPLTAGAFRTTTLIRSSSLFLVQCPYCHLVLVG
jgi:hypothetical protein